MTDRLRRRHRQIFVGLAIVLPAFLSMALAGRPELLADARPRVEAVGRELGAWDDLFSGSEVALRTRLIADHGPAGSVLVVELTATMPLRRPLLGVASLGAGGSSAGDPVWLGRINGLGAHRFTLPRAARSRLHIVDVLTGEVVASAQLPAVEVSP